MNVWKGTQRFTLKPLHVPKGFLSRIFEATRKGDSRRYILKIGTDHPAAQAFSRKIRAFQRESAAYRLLQNHPSLPVPRCYSSVATAEGSDGLIFMERSCPARAGDQVKGLSFHRLASAARSVGMIHARYWKQPTLLKNRALPLHHYNLAHQTKRSLPIFLWNGRSWLSKSEAKNVSRLTKIIGRALRQAKKSPITLIHGDLRADNLLFAGRKTILVDWQMAARGMGAFDLARLIGGSRASELPVVDQRRLVLVWHRTLIRHGVRGYSADAAWRDYLLGVVLSLSIPVTNAVPLARFSPRGREIAGRMVRRFLGNGRQLGLI